ncbi:cable pilus usher protein CblC [Burkholderia stagnalis]|uniref:cable pilus usher protein CblC n=1 Tax=Burkholderia stagnalis TaxID=1503054 RepID=UPI000751B039|nr:cable pilus usher protein CblC [Burkholderia stagnalis]KWH29012.1 fimbrial protein [Burkholderia stagnalis]KWH61871.1 fimbrial protein [Burkholderia stagnalis]
MIPFDLKKTVVACLSAVCVMDLASVAHAASAVPPGFEDIVAGHDERVDITFLGKSLGLFRVFVTPEAVRFEDPARLLRALAEQIAPAADVSAIGDALSKPMARNGNLACAGQAGVNGCGYVETDSAAVIYDESEGSIELFLSHDWLSTEKRDQRFREPSSMTENALIHQQTINLSGGRGYKSLAVSGTGALGITPSSFIGGNWSFTHTSYSRAADSHVQLQDLYYRHDIGSQHYAQAGRMDNRNLASALGGNFGFSMLPVGTLDGVRVGTTLAYVNPEVATQGTPVTLLLPRDSRIDAYRGSELLGTFYMKAGVNSLDTSRFPEGTYPLLLRIFENGVQVRTQTAPFTKTGGGVNSRTRQWFAQAGRAADQGAPDGVAAAAGVRIPLLREMALTSGVASVGRHVFNETALEWRHAFPLGVLSAGGAFFIGNDGSRGNTQQISFADGVSWSVYRYQMRGGACSAPAVSYRDIGCYDMLNATVSFPIGNWSAMLGYTYNKSVGRSRDWRDNAPDRPWAPPVARQRDQVSRAFQVSLSLSVTWRKVSANLRVGAYANRSADVGAGNEYGGYVGVTLSMAEPAVRAGHASAYTSAGVDVRTDRSSTTTNYTLDRNWNWQGDTYRELALGLSGYGTDSLTGTVQGRWNGRYGDVTTSVANSYSRDSGGNNPSVTASYSSSFAVARQGVFLGASASQSDPLAGFAVRVGKRGDASGMAAEVSSASSTRIKVGFGQRALLPVTAFTPVTTEVSDAGARASVGATSVTEGLGKHTLFMVPGQLALRNVDAKVTYTYVGQAFTASGMPLSDSVILNGSMPSLDAEGGFIAELDNKESELFVVDGPSLMRCPLHVKRRQDVLMVVGKVRCDVAGPDALPEALRKHARVQKLLQQRYVMSMRQQATDVTKTAQ